MPLSRAFASAIHLADTRFSHHAPLTRCHLQKNAKAWKWALLICVSAATGSAQDKEPALGEGFFEITPQVGFMGGSTLMGVRGAMIYHGFSLEASADQVLGNFATLYPLTLNFVLNLAQAKRAVPFGLVGGGLFLTKAENTVGDRVVSTLGVNVGGGLRFYLNSRIGFRFETKQYFTEVDNKSEGHSELLIYQSTSLGVIVAFI